MLIVTIQVRGNTFPYPRPLELDYPGQLQSTAPVLDGRLTIGATTAMGTSRVGAVDQTVFARSALIQGPAADNMRSELKASNVQVVTLLNGDLVVQGGSGNNTVAQIDPVNQVILVNGVTNVIGGSGINALAQIISQGTQTLWTTGGPPPNGNINVTGGFGAGANALITAAGLQSLSASGSIVPASTPGGGSAFVGGVAPANTNVPGSPTGSVLALQDNLIGTIVNAEPDDGQNEHDPFRRAPLCN